MRRAVVCGAGGFIAGHLVKRLKQDGWWVRGVDIKPHPFSESPADEFRLLDLRDSDQAGEAVDVPEGADVVFQLAADMGGMGFISSAETEILRNSTLINLNVTYAAFASGAKKYFLSSSVCVYRDMAPGEPVMTEELAYPACPDNEYGWEKLYAERVAMAYGRRHGVPVRIARFENCYGPEGTWTGGREKAPAAICRKVAELDGDGSIEVWGDGNADRVYVYVDDLVDGILKLIDSDITEPTNIGTDEHITVGQLVETVGKVAGKAVTPQYVPGPVGVQSRNFSHERIRSTGWEPRISFLAGIERTYPWIEEQVRAARQ